MKCNTCFLLYQKVVGLFAGAEHLLQINLSDLSETIDHLNSYDVKTILDLISLLSLELELLGSSNIRLNMRVALSSLNNRLTRARSTKKSTAAVPSGPCDSIGTESFPIFEILQKKLFLVTKASFC